MTVGEIWGYTVAGLFRDQADIDSSAIHDFVQASDKVTRPGQVKIADLDGNGFIDPGNFAVDDHGDLRIIGNQSPRYRYGVNLSARWNGIGLSVFLQGVGARDWYPGSDAGMFWGKYGRPFFALIPSITPLHGRHVQRRAQQLGYGLLAPHDDLPVERDEELDASARNPQYALHPERGLPAREEYPARLFVPEAHLFGHSAAKG